MPNLKMSAEISKDDDEYNSSSDEDYDPDKDTEIDHQDEVSIPRYRVFVAHSPEQIDDAEGGEDDGTEEVSEPVQNSSKAEKSSESSSSSTKTVDVDAIFAELTGLAPPSSSSKQISSTTSNDSKPVDKCYPKPPTKTYAETTFAMNCPKKSETNKGTKRIGLLDAAKALSKRSKMSVLDRSDQDWKEFTAQNNLKEDLESHNRGKGGYLNKMDFLNRTDERLFNVERDLRATARKDTGS
ncbi:hypothetical protein CAEBREN_32273 [Caenorhabditis brenneri]|uniref:Craniofacial development protein 1 n=1 Tax=Caenorhabditis brenneri TaxID=135651 RepID=G0NUZ3_CAEBE|nr:hypothetical protein CAEBREN_32273 [Caenorhabditis brenneri]